MLNQLNASMRAGVRTLYDIQHVRIQLGLRLSAQKERGQFSKDWDRYLQAQWEALQLMEKAIGARMGELCHEFDIYPWLVGIKGISDTLATVILAEVQDIERFSNVAKLWAFAGLAVDNKTGRAVRRTKGVKSNWNPFLKTKLLGVLGPNLLRANSPYRKYYDDYKHRMEGIPCSLEPEKHRRGATKDKLLPNGCTKGHMHNKAIRYMVKMLLQEFWVEWRTMRGLEVRPSYAEQYLGIKHHTDDVPVMRPVEPQPDAEQVAVDEDLAEAMKEETKVE